MNADPDRASGILSAGAICFDEKMIVSLRFALSACDSFVRLCGRSDPDVPAFQVGQILSGPPTLDLYQELLNFRRA